MLAVASWKIIGMFSKHGELLRDPFSVQAMLGLSYFALSAFTIWAFCQYCAAIYTFRDYFIDTWGSKVTFGVWLLFQFLMFVLIAAVSLAVGTIINSVWPS